MRIFFALVLMIIGHTPAFARTNISYNDIQYFDGETELEGYWAPSACLNNVENPPMVLIVHQWKGLGEHEKERARALSKNCYTAFAIDIYGKGVRPADNKAAAQESSKYKQDPALARQRLHAALEFAKSQNKTDNIAILGYCFGGTMALEMARSGSDIDGAISFHGGLSTKKPAQSGDIKASILVHHGDVDPYVKPPEVDTFLNEMRSAQADWVFTRYAEAVHAFTHKDAGDDPSKGVAYNKQADLRSWQTTLDFLKEIFKK